MQKNCCISPGRAIYSNEKAKNIPANEGSTTECETLNSVHGKHLKYPQQDSNLHLWPITPALYIELCGCK